MIIVVPARGGSKRIPRKNLQIVGGMTLVRRALETACGLGERVILSTDDVEIAREAIGTDALVRFRSPRAATDSAPMGEVVRDLVDGNWFTGSHVVAVLQPTNPFIRAEHIRRCVWAMPGAAVLTTESGQRVGLYMKSAQGWCEQSSEPDRAWARATYIRNDGPSVDINTPEDLDQARRLWGEWWVTTEVSAPAGRTIKGDEING